MTTECEHCVDGVCQQTKGWCPPKAPRTIMHDPRCKFLRPDGIACTCGSFEREIAAAKLPRTTTTTTEEPAMPDADQTTSQRGRGICDHAASLIDGDRNASYGDAEANFTETGALWAVVFGHEVTAEQVALCLALLKVARLVHNPHHADSWTDGVGYLALGGGIASKPGRYV